MFKIKRLVIILSLLFGISIIYADTINANKIDHKKDNQNLNETQKSDTTKVYILNEENSKNVNNEIINLLFPVFTLILGFLLNVFYNLFTVKKRIKNEGKRWINELFYLQEPLKDQKLSIEDFLVQFQKENFTIPNLYINENLNCEIFKSLDKTIFLKYLENTNKTFQDAVKFSNDVYAFLGSLNFILNEIKSCFNDFKKNSSKSIEIFNINLQKLILILKDFGILIEKKTGQNPLEDDVYKSIYELFDYFFFSSKDNCTYDLFYLEKNFLNPLSDILIKNRLNYDFKEFNIALSDCKNAVGRIQTEKKYLELNFKIIMELIVKSEKILDQLLSINHNKNDETS